MSHFPHSRLFVGPLKTIVISGPHFRILDSAAGTILFSTASLLGDERNSLLKSGPIRCAAIDHSASRFATSGDDKHLKVWSLDEHKLLSHRELPKKPTEIQFTKDGQTILVSDKFGDVFSYPLHPAPAPEKSTKEGPTSHENPSDGKLILGHASVVTSFTLSDDERYIITADRDEHVRVSWYPQGYNIERYCLGHRKYISAIHIPKFSPDTLISGGGDAMLKFWDWMAGTVIKEVEIMSTVEPFIKVKPEKRKRRDDEGVRETKRIRRKKGRAAKAKAKKIANGGTVEENEEEQVAAEETEKTPDTNVEQGDKPSGTEEAEETQDANAEQEEKPAESVAENDQPETVLVLRKLDSLESEGRHIVFTAVGASALFAFTYPEDASSSPTIRSLDFGKPVLDFTIAQDGLIWVAVDPEWVPTEGENQKSDFVYTVKLTSEKFEVDNHSLATRITMNSTVNLLPATPTEIKSLELYTSLESMPKNSTDNENNPAEREDEPLPEEELKPSKNKIQGRLRSKQLLAKKISGVVASGSGLSAGEDEEDVHQAKRAKSEHVEEDDKMEE